MSLTWNEEEERAMDFMQTVVKEWGLQYNHEELTRAIHALQMFVFQHALQRTGGVNGEWYAEAS